MAQIYKWNWDMRRKNVKGSQGSFQSETLSEVSSDMEEVCSM